MEFLFYFIYGILLSEIVMIYILLLLGFLYLIFKFTFWIFEKLEIENPIITIYEFVKEKLNTDMK